MSAVVIWRPEPLTARLIARARPAAEEVAKAAQLRAAAASKSVAASIHMSGSAENFIIGANDPKGILFEKGVRPHEIEPKKTVLRLADGSFVTGSIRHPGMASKPFLRPVLPLWAPLYRRMAAGAFRGF